MRTLKWLPFLVLLLACQNNAIQQANLHTDSACMPGQIMVLPSLDTNGCHSELQAYWILIGDTSRLYWPLLRHASEVAKAHTIVFDSLERHYDPIKQTLVLDQTSDDELYRGEYFPRRMTGTHLSIEPYNMYFSESNSKSFVEVYGIYEQADSALKAMQTYPQAHIKTCKIFMGCLH